MGELKMRFALACCWGCHKPLRVPLHAINLRVLGCHTLHRHCFHLGVFEQLGTNIVYLVQGHQVFERLSPHFEKRKIGDPSDLDCDAMGTDASETIGSGAADLE